MSSNGYLRRGLLGVLSLSLLVICLHPGVAYAAKTRSVNVFEESFSVTAAIDVEVHDADVVLVPHDGSGILVQVVAKSQDAGSDWAMEVFERIEFTARKKNNALVIRTREPRISRSEYQRNGHVWFQIRIAHPTSIDCTVTTGDGDVFIEQIDGEVDVRTGDGDIDLQSIQGPSLAAHTGDGDISVETLNSKSAGLNTGDGDVSISRLNGPLVVRTGDGDIEVSLGNPGDVKLETGDGDVLLRAKANLRADVEFHGEDVSVDGFELRGRINNHRVEGQLNGGGSLLRVTTGDGSIRLRGV